MKERFSHEGRQFVVAFRQNQNQFVVYEEFHHDPFYSWWDDQPSYQLKIKNPTKLVRKIWHTVRQYVYRNKISYFEILVGDKKRSAIYRRFLDTLSGYQYFEYGYSFAVVKMKGDQ
jgi:hypothetical protein